MSPPVKMTRAKSLQLSRAHAKSHGDRRVEERREAGASETSNMVEVPSQSDFEDVGAIRRRKRRSLQRTNGHSRREIDTRETSSLPATLEELRITDDDDNQDSCTCKFSGDETQNVTISQEADTAIKDMEIIPHSTPTRKCSACGDSAPNRSNTPQFPKLCSKCHLRRLERKRSLRSCQDVSESTAKQVPEHRETPLSQMIDNKKMAQCLPSEISVKAEYINGKKSSIRRFPITGNMTFAYLLEKCTEMFGITGKCSLEYNDNDHDFVLMCTDEEVAEMCRIVSTHDISPVHLRITAAS